MSKPIIHANSSARKYGGKPEDYLPIHQLMDSSKGAMADNRHRALTHNSWFIAPDGPLERIFGVSFKNSDGRDVSTRDIGEQHILEDFGNRFIPSVQDYLAGMPAYPWMSNHGVPPSFEKIKPVVEEQPSPELLKEPETHGMFEPNITADLDVVVDGIANWSGSRRNPNLID